MEAQPLDQTLGLADQLLEGLVGLLGQGVLEHLDLVELVAADHAALVGAVGACLAAEARRVGEQLVRQVALRENLAAVQGGEGRFGRREHEVHAVVRRILDLIDLVGELRELSRGLAALILEHQGQADHLVAVLQVLVDEVVKQGPLEARAHAAVDPEAGARQTRAALIVDEAEIRAQVHMVLFT